MKRLLTKAEVMEYCGLNTDAALHDWVARRIIPPAMPGTRRWDRHAIDAALDRASGLVAPSNHLTPYQRWKLEREGQAQGH
jgi:hypothetical protein